MKNRDGEDTFFLSYKELRYNAPITNSREQILKELYRLFDMGYSRYIIGMVDMLDISVAEALREYRDINPQIEYSVILYENQHSKFGPNSKLRAYEVIDSANEAIYISRPHHNKLFWFANQSLMDRLDLSVAYSAPHGNGGVLYIYNNSSKVKISIKELLSSTNIDSIIDSTDDVL